MSGGGCVAFCEWDCWPTVCTVGDAVTVLNVVVDVTPHVDDVSAHNGSNRYCFVKLTNSDVFGFLRHVG